MTSYLTKQELEELCEQMERKIAKLRSVTLEIAKQLRKFALEELNLKNLKNASNI